MASKKKLTVKEYFTENNPRIMKFCERFLCLLGDEELITMYAERDLEKLAKVWKLVIEMFEEHTREDALGRLAELIGEYKDIESGGEE
ncbi:MAG: hypothetical protein NC299_13075 [Lachnospiraceae bacterium]|nr:hypothetical protein [Ruminococcus sp.]MCM1275603.1 hypothetical protein [Lachnospiraceae bacterium]MCM1276270.1 hypothetical protein [Lachnospiraceae bacterium]